MPLSEDRKAPPYTVPAKIRLLELIARDAIDWFVKPLSSWIQFPPLLVERKTPSDVPANRWPLELSTKATTKLSVSPVLS